MTILDARHASRPHALCLVLAAAAVLTGCAAIPPAAQSVPPPVTVTSADGAPSAAALLATTLPEVEASAVETSAAATSSSSTRRELAALVVAPRGSKAGYSRAQFPHWDLIKGSCNTRDEVLQRDGQNVRINSHCAPVEGSWTSPYDGLTWTRASDVDIDHLVPLAQSWVSGASSWPQDRREELANDRTRPELKVVTDELNQAKGDRPPDAWRPPLRSYWCQYATDWITVKRYYDLTITTAEKSALASMLDYCGADGGPRG
jgi:hypothetical protein